MSTEIKILKKKTLNNPVLIMGLPGIGLVGKITVDYFLKQIKSEKIAEVYSDAFPPSVQTNRGIVSLIKDEVYFVEFKKKHYLFLAGPVQPSLDIQSGAGNEHYEFAEKLAQFALEMGVKEIITLAGINIGDKRMELKPKIVVAATSRKLLMHYKELGCKLSDSHGLISGAAGLLLAKAKIKGIDGACLMGETSSRLVYGDHGAAKSVIDLLVDRFGFKIKMQGIEKEAKNIEQAFKTLNKQLEQSKPKEEELEQTGLTYVR